MKKSFFLWMLSLLITISIAVYQRLTDSTYPSKEKNKIEHYISNNEENNENK